MKWISAAIVAICAGFALPSACAAAEFIVDRNDDTVDAIPGNGQCADSTDGGCSVRAALIEANALPGHDRIILPEGVFTFSRSGSEENLAASGDLDVTGAVDIIGSGSASTILDAASLDRVFDLRSADAGEIRLEGLTLRKGWIDAQPLGNALTGIGVNVHPLVRVQLEDLVLRNHGAPGEIQGATIIANNNGCVVGRRVRILDNRVPDQFVPLNASGGIATTGADSCMELEDLEITGNDGRVAGAIYLDGGATMTIRRALIANNRSSHIAAVLVNGNNDVLMENVTISGNQGDGAILNDGNSDLHMINCTITGNRGLDGRPIPNWTGLLDGHGPPSRMHLTNTIVAGNGPGRFSDDCFAVTSIGGGNLIGHSRGCTVVSQQPSDQLDVDAQLQGLADIGGFSPAHMPGGAAVDHGSGAHCPLVDQRGVLRPQDGDGDGQASCDAGAIEVVLPAFFTNGFED